MKNNLFETILERLGKDQEAGFGFDEVESWSPHEWNAFQKTGIFRKAAPIRALECRGCEENCVMPVDVIPSDGERPARAFISCDKRDDIGRVSVKLQRLEQWKITGHLLAKKIASLLDFSKEPKEESQGKRWVLGILKGKEHQGQVALLLENGIFLKISGHTLPLSEVLTWCDGKLILAKDALLRLVDKPTKPSHYKPSIVFREARKSKTQKTHLAWQKTYRELKRKRPNMSDMWYSQQIAKSAIAQGKSAETIRKNMKK